MEGEHHGAEVAGNRVGQIEVGLSIKHVTLERNLGGALEHRLGQVEVSLGKLQ